MIHTISTCVSHSKCADWPLQCTSSERGYAVLFVYCILVFYRVEGQGEGLAVITDVTYSSQTTTSEEKEASGSKEEYQRIQVKYTY